MQLLQGIRPAESGGDSYLVDARAAAAQLRSLDDEAYELLTRTRVRFHRKQTGFEKILDASILSGEGETFQVRWSYFTLAPYRLPFARMEAWYRAHARFARLVRDPQHQLRFSLGPGDFVLYDNYRMLHARTAFRGARWLRGVYFDRRALAAEVGASAPL
jgi:alpha-ketoglutarate-dependent taurine dioxygenase